MSEQNQGAIDLPASAVTPATAKPPIAGGPSKSAMIPFDERGVSLRSMEDLFLFAKAVIDSKLAPRGFDTPQAILVAIQYGAELGLGPMASLQNIAVIQGRPTLWGDAVPAVCQSLLEEYKDEEIGEPGKDSRGWKVTVKRKGRAEPIARTFTVADAKTAGLWGKQGPWSTNPGRMIFMRARSFCFRDAFPDKLKGILTAEEATDVEMKNVTRSLEELEKKSA